MTWRRGCQRPRPPIRRVSSIQASCRNWNRQDLSSSFIGGRAASRSPLHLLSASEGGFSNRPGRQESRPPLRIQTKSCLDSPRTTFGEDCFVKTVLILSRLLERDSVDRS